MPTASKFRLRLKSNFNTTSPNYFRLSEMAFANSGSSPSQGVAMALTGGSMAAGTIANLTDGSTGQNLAIQQTTAGTDVIVQFDVTVGTLTIDRIYWYSPSVSGNLNQCPKEFYADYWNGSAWVQWGHWLLSTNPWTAINQVQIFDASNDLPDITKDVSFNWKVNPGKSVSFNWQVLAATDITKDVSFDWGVEVGKTVGFDYAINLGRDVSFNWGFDLAKDVGFDWAVDLRRDVSFDWAISVSRDISFDWAIGLGVNVGFDWSIGFGRSFSFDWAVETGKDVLFDWRIEQDITRDVSFDWAVATYVDATFEWSIDLHKDVSFDWGTELGRDVAFDWALDLHRDVDFAWQLNSPDVVKDVPFDWGIDLGKDAAFDWKIEYDINTDVSFNWAIQLGKAVAFDWQVLSLVNADVSFNWKIELGKSASFNWQVLDDAETFRYHRLWFTLPHFNVGSDAYITYSEIDLRDASNTRLVGTASASSAYYSADFAQDGNPATAWGSDTPDTYQIAWYQLDMGVSGAPVIDHFTLMASGAESEKTEGARDLYYTVSNDGVNWDIWGRYYNNPVPTTINQVASFDTEEITLPDLGAHRFWGIQFYSNEAAGAYTGLATLRFKERPFGPNIPTNSGVAGASSVSFSAVAANAFDNDLNTIWGGATGGGDPNAKLWYDFGAGNEKHVGAVMFGAGFTGLPGYPLEFDLIYSEDGVDWTVAKEFRAPEVSTTPWVANEYRAYDVYGASGASIKKDVSFDWSILAPTFRDVSFAWQVPFGKNFSFEWSFDGVVYTDLSFDWAINVGKLVGFDWQVLETEAGVVCEFVFDWSIMAPNRERPFFRMPPETPIAEVWAFSSNVFTSDNGTEQRAQLRNIPRVGVNPSYLVLNDADRRVFFTDFMKTAGAILIPLPQYGATARAPVAAGETTLEINAAICDIRGGDYVHVSTPDKLYGWLEQVLDVTGNTVTLLEGLQADIPRGAQIVPCRLMKITDGGGIAMRSIAGAVSFSAASLDYRELGRPTAQPLVTFFDGMPVLHERGRADNDVGESFTSRSVVLDIAKGGNPEIFEKWRMVAVSGERRWRAPRLTGLDFWREFAVLVGGQARPFLVPSWRQDFEPVSIAGDILTVRGKDHADLVDFDAYSRVQIETNAGVANYRIEEVTDATGGLDLRLDRFIVGTTVRRVSYLVKHRMDDDNVSLTHYQDYTEIALNVRTTNE